MRGGLVALVPYERRVKAPMLRLSPFRSRQFDAINIATALTPAPRTPRPSCRPPLLWGLGIGLAVTPLSAAVLAAVSDSDLGEASAVNDTAARLGG